MITKPVYNLEDAAFNHIHLALKHISEAYESGKEIFHWEVNSSLKAEVSALIVNTVREKLKEWDITRSISETRYKTYQNSTAIKLFIVFK